MPNGLQNRMRYTRQTIVTNTFYQTPRFLMAGEFAGNKLSNSARILYMLLLDRHRISIKNGWFDNNGEVYIYFKREEMETLLGLSDKTVVKAMQELKNLFLVEEKQQGMNKPNKIYLLSPIIANDENPDPYLDPDTDYNPEKTEDYGYASEPVISPTPDAEDFRFRTRKNSVPEPVISPTPDTEDFRPNNNKLNNNKKKNNKMNDNELSETATAISGTAGKEPPAAEAEAENQTVTPYSQILEMYNEICETKGLRPIRSIDGKRKTHTAARFKEYGLSGFVDLFEKTTTSAFLCGGGERGWQADFDWLIAPTNFTKVLEGKYDNDQYRQPQQNTVFYHKQEQGDPFLNYARREYENATRYDLLR